jgi:hypothetical protein
MKTLTRVYDFVDKADKSLNLLYRLTYITLSYVYK